MTECVNYFLLNEYFVTYGAVLTFGKTGCGTGRRYCLIYYYGVTECVNYFLLNENLVTYGAVLTLGKTGCGTGRRYCLVNYLGVTECVNASVYVRVTATVTSVSGVTFLSASRSGYNGLIIVTECCFKLSATYGTGLSIGTVSILAKRVAEFVNYFLCNENYVTYGAVLTLSKTGLGTGGCYRLVNYLGVAECGIENNATYGTGLCSSTGCCCACGVTECVNYFLLNENLVTYGAVLALGKTGFGAGRRYCLIYYYGVTECGVENNATYGTGLSHGTGCVCACGVAECRYKLSTTYGTGLRGGTGCCCACGMSECCNLIVGVAVATNRTSMSCVTFLIASRSGYNGIVGVTKCCHNLLCNENLVTYAAVATLGKTGCGTGRCYCLIGYCGVTECCFKLNATYGTNLSGSTGCACAESMSLSGNYSFLSFAAITLFHKTTVFGTGCFLRGYNLSEATSLTVIEPYTVNHGVFAGSGSYFSFVSVRKNDGSNTDLGVTKRSTFLFSLNGGGFGTLGNLDICTVFAVDISATGGSVYITCGSINYAARLNVNLSINEIVQGTGILLTGSVSNANKRLVCGACITVSGCIALVVFDFIKPIFNTVNIYLSAGAQGHLSVFTNDKLCAGKNCKILVDDSVSAYNLYGKVVGYRKVIILRIDACATHRHSDRINLHITVYFDMKSIFVAVIALYNVAAGKIEHRTALCKEGNGRIKGTERHSNRRIAVEYRAGINGHGNLNVLYVVLSYGEYGIFYTTGCATATVVADLEYLIYVSTGVYGNSTLTGNVTVYVHTAVDGNVTSGLHINEAVAAYRTTASRSCLSSLNNRGNAERTVNYKLRTLCHSESSISSRLCSSGRNLWRSSHYRIGCIIGYQESNTRGNGISACGKSTVGCNNYSFVRIAGSVANSLIKVCIKGSTYGIASLTVVEYSLDFRIGFSDNATSCFCRNKLVGISVYPSHKCRACISFSNKLSTFYAVKNSVSAVSNRGTANSYTALSIIVREGAVVVYLYSLKLYRHLGKVKSCGLCTTSACLNLKGDGVGFACCNFYGFITCTAAERFLIGSSRSKFERCFNRGVVINCDSVSSARTKNVQRTSSSRNSCCVCRFRLLHTSAGSVRDGQLTFTQRKNYVSISREFITYENVLKCIVNVIEGLCSLIKIEEVELGIGQFFCLGNNFLSFSPRLFLRAGSHLRNCLLDVLLTHCQSVEILIKIFCNI